MINLCGPYIFIEDKWVEGCDKNHQLYICGAKTLVCQTPSRLYSNWTCETFHQKKVDNTFMGYLVDMSHISTPTGPHHMIFFTSKIFSRSLNFAIFLFWSSNLETNQNGHSTCTCFHRAVTRGCPASKGLCGCRKLWVSISPATSLSTLGMPHHPRMMSQLEAATSAHGLSFLLLLFFRSTNKN